MGGEMETGSKDFLRPPGVYSMRHRSTSRWGSASHSDPTQHYGRGNGQSRSDSTLTYPIYRHSTNTLRTGTAEDSFTMSDSTSLGSDIELRHKTATLKGCGLLCFSAGAYNKYERPRWAHEPQHFLALGSSVLGIYHLCTFPNSVAQFGGAAFLVAYAIVNLLLGFPVLTLEVLLGQFSGRNTVAIYGRLWPLATGIGWASVFISFLKLTFFVPTVGTAFFALVRFSVGEPTTCGFVLKEYLFDNRSTDHLRFCYDAEERVKCEEGRNGSVTGFYYKGTCFPHTKRGHDQLLDLLASCLLDPQMNYNRKPGNWLPARPEIADLLQLNISCGFSLVFCPPVLRQTPWFRRYHQSRFLVAREDCGYRCRGSWRLWDDAEEEDPEPLELRLQLIDDISATRYHSPFASALRFNEFLRGHNYTLHGILAEYCAASGLALWPCLQKTLYSRENHAIIIFIQGVIADRSPTFLFTGPALFAIAITWVIVFVPTTKGPQWLAKTLMATSCWPSLLITAMVLYGWNVPGFQEGVWTWMKPDWCRLRDPYTWLMAVWQNLINIPVGAGVAPVLSSFATFQQDALAQTVGVALWSLSFAVLSTVFGFGFLGILAGAMERRLDEVVLHIDETYQGLGALEVALYHFSGRLLMMATGVAYVTLGLGSAFSIYESVICSITEHIGRLSRRRPMGRVLVSSLLTLFAIVGSIPVTSNHASLWHEVLLTLMVALSLLNVLLTLFLVVFVYGIRKWSRDLDLMFLEQTRTHECVLPRVSGLVWGSPLRHYFQFTWAALPFLLAGLLTWHGLVEIQDAAAHDRDNQAAEAERGPETRKYLDTFTASLKSAFPALLFGAYLLFLFLPGLTLAFRRWREGKLYKAVCVGKHWRPNSMPEQQFHTITANSLSVSTLPLPIASPASSVFSVFRRFIRAKPSPISSGVPR